MSCGLVVCSAAAAERRDREPGTWLGASQDRGPEPARRLIRRDRAREGEAHVTAPLRRGAHARAPAVRESIWCAPFQRATRRRSERQKMARFPLTLTS